MEATSPPVLPKDFKLVKWVTWSKKLANYLLQVRGQNDTRYLIMSQAAYDSLLPKQIEILEGHCELFSSSLDTIEACGGGSARCMMAEIFLPKKNFLTKTHNFKIRLQV